MALRFIECIEDNGKLKEIRFHNEDKYNFAYDTVDAIAEKEPEVAACCVPECVYRGFCPEFKPCGYCGSPAWKKAVDAYREVK